MSVHGPRSGHTRLEVFADALELPFDQRDSFVREACHGDAALEQEVRSLLEHSDGDVLSRSASELVGVNSDRDALEVGASVGSYTIAELIGSGGMGNVYRATQDEPIRREVAVKVVKPGMDSDAILGRFHTERSILAQLEHPGIARVYEAGKTDSGRPYFAMELVRGVAADVYCRDRQLSLHERLELVIAVGRAVQHAHMRGVIHRDLKPSNVLVVEHEGLALPKIIDFGVAKALSTESEHFALQTQVGELIGTPAFMCPEQASGLQDIDVRADVYALGVLTYQLVTGRFPYETPEGKPCSAVSPHGNAPREPVRPSTRLSQVLDCTDRSASCPEDASSVRRALKTELDWVILKAISPDRQARYESATEFVSDLENFIAQRPLTAKPPSVRYRCTKFCQRRKGLVSTCSIGVLGIMAGGAVLAWTQAETAAAHEAQRLAATRAAAVTEFQANQLRDLQPQSIGDNLRHSMLSAVPDEDREAVETVFQSLNFTDFALGILENDLFAPTIRAIDEEFASDQVTQAALLQAAARRMRSLGLVEAASDPQGRALDLRVSALGPGHPDAIESRYYLGLLQLDQGQMSSAESTFRQVLDSNPADRVKLDTVGMLAIALRRQARFDEAKNLLNEALVGIGQSRRGEEYYAALHTLGAVHRSLGEYAEAREHFTAARDFYARELGSDSSEALVCAADLAHAEQRLGDVESARDTYRQVVAGLRRVHGDLHPETLTALGMLAGAHESLGEFTEAVQYQREAYEGNLEVLGPDHPSTLRSAGNLASRLQSAGQIDEARTLYSQVVEARSRILGEGHPSTIITRANFATLLLDASDAASAVAVLSGVEENARDLWADGDEVSLGSILVIVGRVRHASAQYAEAELVLVDAYRMLTSKLGREHRRSRDCARRLLELYETWQLAEPSESLQAEVEAWRAKADGTD